MSDKARLNHILRMDDAASNYQTIANPVQTPPLERDHFLEVQHIVDIVLNRYSETWWDMKMGYFIDLSTFVNEHRNIFAINQAFNQQKKRIPFNQYPNDVTIQSYLAFTTTDGKTVEANVEALVYDMVNRQGNYPDVTRYVGNEIKRIMNW